MKDPKQVLNPNHLHVASYSLLHLYSIDTGISETKEPKMNSGICSRLTPQLQLTSEITA